MTTVEFDYDLGEQVTIKLNECTGEVKGMWWGQNKTRYICVAYVDTKGVIHEGWFLEADLKREEN